MGSPLEGFAFDTAGAGAETALGYLAQSQLSSQQQKYYRENMKKSFGYSQLAQKLAPTNVKQGLVMAGLNPALAVEGRFSPAQSPSAPLGSNSIGMPSIDGAQSALMMSEAKKANAEARNIELKNEQIDDENKIGQGLAISQLQRMADELPDTAYEAKARMQALADMAKNRGSLSALMSFSDMLDKRESYNSRYIQNRLQKAVVDYQLDEKHGFEGHSIIADLANLPSAEFAKLHATTMDLLRHAEWLSKNKELTEEEKNLKLEQIKLTKEQINNLVAATKRINDTNLMKIADDVGAGKESPWKLLAAIAFVIFGNTHIGF